MQQPPTPLPILRKGTPVKAYIGAGWGKGVVEYSDKQRCVVLLAVGNRRISIYDSRNITTEIK